MPDRSNFPHQTSPAPTAAAPPRVVSIAGVDPSGGAGVLADIKTFSALGAYGCGVIAALTAQNTQAVTGIHVPPCDFIALQMDTLAADVRIDGVKIGMLASGAVIQTVARRLEAWHKAGQGNFVVLDPVMVAKSGDALLKREAIVTLRDELLPRTRVLTPNLPEAGVLLESGAPENKREMYRAAERLRRLLPDDPDRWILLKGGHLPGDELTDLLTDGDRMVEFVGPRIPTRHTHGTGCALSAAITALRPREHDTPGAVGAARLWLRQAIAAADRLQVGHGHGPVHHFHATW